VRKNRSEAIWQRFRTACDKFFNRFAQRHEIARGERVAAREAICVELEAIAGADLAVPPAAAVAPDEPAVSPTDGDAAAAGDASTLAAEASAPAAPAADPPVDLLARVRSLRSRWQQELALRGVEPDRAAALDRRFAAAFDRTLARWPQVFAATDLDPDANRQRMEALVRRVEALAASLAPAGAAGAEALSPAERLAAMLKEALAQNTIGGKVDEESRWRAAQEDVRQAQSSWTRIGSVPEPARRALAERFQRACRRVLEGGGVTAGSGSSASRPLPTRPEPPRPGGSGRSSGSGGPGGSSRPAGSGRPAPPARPDPPSRAD
jgi:hypothetical protein